MIVLIIVVATVWLGGLTILVLALTRQTAALQIAITQRSGDHFSVDADGPDIGTLVPSALAEIVSVADGYSPSTKWVIVVLSATCGNCMETVEALDRRELDAVGTMALIPDESPAADELAKIARQKFDAVEYGGTAKAVSAALNIHSVPFVVGLSAGTVRGKRYVRKIDDIYGVISEMNEDGTRTKRLAVGKAEV